MNLTTHLKLVTRLRKFGTICPFLHDVVLILAKGQLYLLWVVSSAGSITFLLTVVILRSPNLKVSLKGCSAALVIMKFSTLWNLKFHPSSRTNFAVLSSTKSAKSSPASEIQHFEFHSRLRIFVLLSQTRVTGSEYPRLYSDGLRAERLGFNGCSGQKFNL
jgi:hypothetical protein